MTVDQRRGSLLVIFLTVLIDLLGFGMVLPLLPLYGDQFARMHDLSPTQVGWTVGLLMASFSAMQFLFLPIWGRLSDRIGRRPVLIVGLTGSTLFYALFGLSTAWQSLIGLFIARIGAGIAGATISTAQAYIADVTTKEKRAKGMALIGAAFALGFTLGPLLGAVALLGDGKAELSPWPGYTAACLSGVALLLAIFRLPESLRPGASAVTARSWWDSSSMRAALATPSVGTLIVTSFIAVFSFANFESTLSKLIDKIMLQFEAGTLESPLLTRLTAAIYRRGYDDANDVRLIVVLVVFAFLGLVLTLAQGVLVRRLAGRLSEATMAVVGALSAIAGFALLGWAARADDFPLVLVAIAIEVVGFAFVNPSLQSLISRRSDPARQGGILGLAQSATSLARIFGTLYGLRLFAQSPPGTYWSAAGLMCVGLALIIVAARGGRDYPSAPAAAAGRLDG